MKTIHIHRPDYFFSAGRYCSWRIYVNGDMVGAIKKGERCCITVDHSVALVTIGDGLCFSNAVLLSPEENEAELAATT